MFIIPSHLVSGQNKKEFRGDFLMAARYSRRALKGIDSRFRFATVVSSWTSHLDTFLASFSPSIK